MIIAEDEKKSPTELQQLQGGQIVKYQGISIIQRNNCSTWQARFRRNGKQFSVSGKTQKECYIKLKTELKKVQSKTEKQTRISKTTKTSGFTLYSWFEKWVDLFKKNVKQTTREDYFKSMKYLKPLHHRQLDLIKSIEIIEILNSIKFERRRQIVYDLVSALFLKAYQSDLITKNPMIAIEKPKHVKKNGEVFTDEDEVVLEKVLKKQNLDVFLVCLYQGLRRGEVLALTSEDIDFEKKTITINKAINQHNELDTTKNEQSVRTMPMFEKTISILEKYKNTTGRIFSNHYNSYNKTWTMIMKEYFPNKKYRIHSLRHTFITRCQEAGIPLYIIQKWVGHRIGSTVTTNVYTHTRESEEQKNIELLNEKLHSNCTHFPPNFKT